MLEWALLLRVRVKYDLTLNLELAIVALLPGHLQRFQHYRQRYSSYQPAIFDVQPCPLIWDVSLLATGSPCSVEVAPPRVSHLVGVRYDLCQHANTRWGQSSTHLPRTCLREHGQTFLAHRLLPSCFLEARLTRPELQGRFEPDYGGRGWYMPSLFPPTPNNLISIRAWLLLSP